MASTNAKKILLKNADYTLLSKKLENKIIEGGDKKEIERILKNNSILSDLDEEMLIKWSELARMNCSIDAAEKIYNFTHNKFPKNFTAFENHIEMLSILNEKEKLLKITALAKQNGFKTTSAFFQIEEKTNEIEQSFYPLENLRKNQELIKYYFSLFKGRTDVFARQWHSKEKQQQGYVPVRQILTEDEIESHISGRESLGIYILNSDNSVNLGVIDIDLTKEVRSQNKRKLIGKINQESQWMVKRIKEISGKYGLNPLLEFSGGKGYHFWYFFKNSPKAGIVKKLLESITSEIKNDLTYFNLEVFPKQDYLSGKGLGNLVKLPLGIHKKTGKKSYFPECKKRETQSQLEFLKKYSPQEIGNLNIKESKAEVKDFPLKKNSEFPEIVNLKNLCPPIGQIIVQCLNKNNISRTQEKIIYQTIGFLPQGRRLVHSLFQRMPDYNDKLVDLYLTRLKGTPLGCRRIHNITEYSGSYCYFEKSGEYLTPLLHLGFSPEQFKGRSEKTESLQQALENLKTAILIVERYIK
ncbi:MAG: CRISPR-associated primase-polymerase type A1 [Desulforegulaceae bacterium]|nr:CRISPR-associated primase-polymerase type A1 [Desulforegulaceae bacterium]